MDKPIIQRHGIFLANRQDVYGNFSFAGNLPYLTLHQMDNLSLCGRGNASNVHRKLGFAWNGIDDSGLDLYRADDAYDSAFFHPRIPATSDLDSHDHFRRGH